MLFTDLVTVTKVSHYLFLCINLGNIAVKLQMCYQSSAQESFDNYHFHLLGKTRNYTVSTPKIEPKTTPNKSREVHHEVA